MAVHFGTDGIRGRAVRGDHRRPGLPTRSRGRRPSSPVPIFVGYDTRESSPVLLARPSSPDCATAARSGVNLGVFTTPGVAVIAQRARRGRASSCRRRTIPTTTTDSRSSGVGGAQARLRDRGGRRRTRSTPRPARAATPSTTSTIDVERRARVRRAPAHVWCPATSRRCTSCSTAPTARRHTWRTNSSKATGARVTTMHDTPNGTQHQPRLRFDPPRGPASRRGANSAPTSASPSTATPID